MKEAMSRRTKEGIYLEYLNEWLTVEAMADNYARTEQEMQKLIDLGKAEHIMATLRKEFKEELVKLGVYDAWESNMLTTYENPSMKIDSLNRLPKFGSFIAWSFPWGMAREGSSFWSSIYKQYEHENI